MARIRYLKPDFFKDEDVARLPYEARIFFQGLWGQADKAGRLEDRPERLKVEIVPYDSVNAEEILALLAKPKKSGRPFIIRYEVDGEKYIQILSWAKHQRPHPTEAESKIPPPDNRSLTVKQPLNKCSKTLETEKGMGKVTGSKRWSNKFDPLFEIFWNTYPLKIDKQESKEKFKTIIEKGQAHDVIKAANGYCDFLKHRRIHDNFEQEPMHPPKFLTKDAWKEYVDFKYNPPM